MQSGAKMQEILRYVLLLLISLFVVTCNENNPTETDSIKYYSVTGTIYNSINEQSPESPSGIPIVIDNDTAISKTEGKFTFDRISKGTHIISVSLPQYQLYTDTITVSKDTNIVIWLNGITEDYFPIHENYQKKYKYHSSIDQHMYAFVSNGEALWKVHSAKLEGGAQIYNVQETLIYTSHKEPTSVYGDTTQTDTVITSFEIIENASHQVTIKSSMLNGVSFNRYLDPREGEIIKRFYDTITISLKKNIGLYKSENNSYRTYISYELIE